MIEPVVRAEFRDVTTSRSDPECSCERERECLRWESFIGPAIPLKGRRLRGATSRDDRASGSRHVPSIYAAPAPQARFRRRLPAAERAAAGAAWATAAAGLRESHAARQMFRQ